MKQLFFIALTVLFISCNDTSKYSKLPEQKVAEPAEVTGVVVKEVMEAGGYTYIKGVEGGEEIWMAIPQTKIEVGQTVYYQGGMVMKNFESKQLNRTFENILFLEGISFEKEAAKPVKNPHQGTAAEVAKTERPPLPQISLPEDVVSIEDIFSKRSEFEGKTLKVYGVVWKVNNGILDRNWVHIEDGTSTEDKSSLTITTQEMIKVGDTIKMTGKIILNKDFGYGYVYDVLLEESTLVK